MTRHMLGIHHLCDLILWKRRGIRRGTRGTRVHPHNHRVPNQAQEVLEVALISSMSSLVVFVESLLLGHSHALLLQDPHDFPERGEGYRGGARGQFGCP